MSPEREPRGSATGKVFYGWVIALCCTLITIINGGVFFTFSVFFKPVALDFGWSRGEFAGNYTAMLLAYAPGAFFAGKLADRYGPRSVLLLASLLIGLGFIGCSQANNLPFMILCYTTLGLGLGTTLALPTATIQRWFVRWRGVMVGIVVAGNGVGGFIFAPLINYLITLYGWQTTYLIIGIIYGGVVAISAVFLVADPKMKGLTPFGSREHVQDSGARPEKATLPAFTSAQAFKLRAFRALAAIHILSFMPAFFTSTHLVPYVTDRGISAAVAAQGLGLIAGMSVVGRVAMSWVAGRIGWMKSLAIAYFLATISVIWLLFVTEPVALYLFVVFYGFSWGSTLALLGGATGFLFGLTSLSELLGFLLGLGVLVGAITPLLGGLSFDITGSYLTAMILAAISFATAGLLSLLLKPPAR